MPVMNHLRGIVLFPVIVLNTLIACVPLFIMAAARALSGAPARPWWNRQMDKIIDYWTGCNRWLVRVLRCCTIAVEVPADTPLRRDQWYLITCNHQSWSDILVLQNGLRYVLPPVKFFTKQELIWLPALGLAMWALGFPYVKRPTREAIAANPALKGVDRAAVQRACAGFRQNPVAVLNFTEGTRFTAAKQAAQGSPYRYLLKPRVGGVELVLNGLQEQLNGVLDATIYYPDLAPTFWQFICGTCPRAELHLRYLPLPAAVRDDLDTGSRTLLSEWLESLWEDKDAALHEHHTENGAAGGTGDACADAAGPGA
ncbi:MAG: acetyltransferase [Pseudomonadota bacterium]